MSSSNGHHATSKDITNNNKNNVHAIIQQEYKILSEL